MANAEQAPKHEIRRATETARDDDVGVRRAAGHAEQDGRYPRAKSGLHDQGFPSSFPERGQSDQSLPGWQGVAM